MEEQIPQYTFRLVFTGPAEMGKSSIGSALVGDTIS
jgi:hypothetical protein